MPAINKQSRIPYYFQLAETLRQQIKDAAASGQVMPLASEHELAEKHQISRATVRHALDILEREGLIYKARGKGTFIAKARAKYELTWLVPTTEDISGEAGNPALRSFPPNASTRYLRSRRRWNSATATKCLKSTG